ncbi:hypothetical protein FSP39_020459 [Pinctada imbricata]|uniref:RING-type domain-containing protein n=1 Tax=Pinctada imbricata TaxID=66713 RepID=A0AA88Y0B0_PINIB|nr:hypothetical protein FSP39_020459 [Pinctada imbricata]
MGLCKCPKKKVTNIFCFEHRVNVCEHCLVANHEKCVVKSYLLWLQDSDYNPICKLCDKRLDDDDCGECVRLVCYCLFHWSCINQYAQQMPPNTAPAGYLCPECQAGIFPAQNLVSPVADKLKEKLSTVNWARAGLGLPLIDEPVEEEIKPTKATAAEASIASNTPSTPAKSDTASLQYVSSALGVTPLASSPKYTRPSAHVSPNQHSVISVDAGTSARGLEKSFAMGDTRKLFDTTKEETTGLLNMSTDHDENKYRRRSAFEWLTKWLNSRENKHKKKDPNAVRKKFLMVLVIGIIGFITLVIVFSRLGERATDDDPFLDPRANPNIIVDDVDKNRVLVN